MIAALVSLKPSVLKSKWHRALLLVGTTATMLCASCRDRGAVSTSHPVRESPFEYASHFGEVVPLADGAAYLVSDRGIFYLRGSESVRVKGLVLDSLLSDQVFPLADGTALLRISIGAKEDLYRLEGDHADKVREVKELSPASRAHAVYPCEYNYIQSMGLKRKLEEKILEDIHPEPENPSD